MLNHVAIIMDGNGRWAKSRHLPRAAGHREGSKAVQRAIEFCLKHEIKILSLFALGIENRLNRPLVEIKFLLDLFLDVLQKHTEELHKQNICIKVVGDRSRLSNPLLQQIIRSEQLTKENSKLQLNIAIDYSGRWDILQAARNLLEQQVAPDDVDEALFSRNLCFASVPEPDLLIRTSGEQRISNFMLWQLAYTEFFFTDVFWPDFDENVLSEAVQAYQKRERRFGFTGEQLKKEEIC